MDSTSKLNGDEEKTYLSKFEMSRLLSVRAIQLSVGAPPTIDPEGETDCYKIAKLELQNRTIPLSIVRKFPTDVVEQRFANSFTYTY